MSSARCPVGTKQSGLYCIKELPRPKIEMKVLTIKDIHTKKMGKEDWIDLPMIDIPKWTIGKVTYVAGIGSPEFHVRWNIKKGRKWHPETIEEDIGATRDEVVQVVKILR